MMKTLCAALALSAPLLVAAQGTVECGTANSPQCGPGGHAIYPGYGWGAMPYNYGYGYVRPGVYSYGYGLPGAAHPRDRDGNGVINRADRDTDRDGVINRYDADRDGDGVRNRYDRLPRNPYRR